MMLRLVNIAVILIFAHALGDCSMVLTDMRPGGGTHDVDRLGVPAFINLDFIELEKIGRISRFRSAVGPDYSDPRENCRSMRHFYEPLPGIDPSVIRITTPVRGTVTGISSDSSGTTLEIEVWDYPAFTIILSHLGPGPSLQVGQDLVEGQRVASLPSPSILPAIALRVNTPAGWRLVSYFEAMTPQLFGYYARRGIPHAREAIITGAERDRHPLTCEGDGLSGDHALPDWLELTRPAVARQQ